MANLFFPQLLTGAMVQYPLRKTKQFRTVVNVYADGSLTSYADPSAGRAAWQLQLSGISGVELGNLQTLYAQCSGPLAPFTFIDPTDNMLVSSADLTASPWVLAPGCTTAAGVPDPQGATGAFSLVNASQTTAGLSQSLAVPANYQYSFSAFVCSAANAIITLQLSGASASAEQSFVTTTGWTRIAWSPRLNDSSTAVTCSLLLPAGETVQLFGPQLEGQHQASAYKSTTARGAVYPNCHWIGNTFAVTALGPNLFAVACSIETTL